MSLINEKKMLINLVKEETNTKYMFETIAREKESYYIDYNDSIHMSRGLVEYSSSDLIEVKHKLEYLWRNNPEMKKYIKVILVALSKSSANHEGRFQGIDLHNYMM